MIKASKILDNQPIFRFNVTFFILTYILPMVGMAICYGQMGMHLWTGDKEMTIKTIMPHTASIKHSRSKKRVRFCHFLKD